MKITTLSILSTALLAAVTAQAAHAGPFDHVPEDCRPLDPTQPTRDPEYRQYNTGYTAGRSIVRNAWNIIDDCGQVDRFSGIVADNVERLTLPANASKALVCRYAGQVNGVYDEIDANFNTCVDQCFFDGVIAGEMAGEIYCELSIALGGLALTDDFIRGPVETCGFGFEVACDSSFIDFTINYSTPATPPAVSEQCEPYTDGEFVAVWDQTRNNSCAYDPIEPEPTSSPLRSEAAE